jgi:hypothetical protein
VRERGEKRKKREEKEGVDLVFYSSFFVLRFHLPVMNGTSVKGDQHVTSGDFHSVIVMNKVRNDPSSFWCTPKETDQKEPSKFRI